MPSTQVLSDRIYASFIGSAIGDAMGGPVEMQTFEAIEEAYGRVVDLMPYAEMTPSPHGPWDVVRGTHTDDTRLAKILARVIINTRGRMRPGDIAFELGRTYHTSHDECERVFLEDYYLKFLHRDQKTPFGGNPTNGGVMAVTPVGLMYAADPHAAFDAAYDSILYATGYGRTATGMAAAAIAAAFTPGSNPEAVVQAAVACADSHARGVEGPSWPAADLYARVGRPAQDLATAAVEHARLVSDPFRERAALRQIVARDFVADGAETLAIALAMVVAAGGDFVASVTGAVNFGRDNDSSACVAGAIAAGLGGLDSIPKEWIETVEAANGRPTIRTLSDPIAELVATRGDRHARIAEAVQSLSGC